MRSKDLSGIAVAVALSVCMLSQPSALAKKDKSGSDSPEEKVASGKTPKNKKSHKSEKSRKRGQTAGIGLDSKVLKLVNKGDWKSASKQLEALVGTQGKQATRDAAWLSFSYLFLGQCDELKALSERVGAIEPTAKTSDSNAKSSDTPKSTDKGAKAGDGAKSISANLLADADKGSDSAKGSEVPKGSEAPKASLTASGASDLSFFQLVIKAFHECCQAHFDEADSTLQKMPREYANDALAYYALSAVAGKQGKAGAAVEYLQRCVALAPDFGWGYRTLGYLQQRWLKDFQGADKSLSAALDLEPSQKEVRDMVIDGRLSRNDFDGAVESASAGVKSNPKDSHNYYRLSQIYTQQWRLKESLNQLNKAISLDSSEPKYYRSKATIRRYQGDLNAAISDQQKAVELGKDKPFELVELASMNLAAGNNNRAADNLREALKLDPENQLAHEKLVEVLQDERRFDDLVEELTRAISKRPKEGKLHLELAQALLDSGKKDKAIEEFIEAGNLNQTDPEPHRQLAAVYVNDKDFAKAAKSYTRALNANPSSVPDFVALGYCYAETDDYMQAEAAFVTAIALQQFTGATSGPNKLDILRSLSSLLFEEGRYADAAAQFEAVLASTKGSAQEAEDTFLLSEAKALRDLSQGSSDQLLDAFEKLPQERKDAQRAALIDTLIAAKRYDTALSLLDKLADAKPQDRWSLLKAKALRMKGDTEASAKLLAQVVQSKELSPSQLAEAYVEQANILMNKDDAAAETAAKTGVETYNKSFKAYTILGRILLNKGDASQAIDAAKKALELNPYHAQAYVVQGDAQQKKGELKEATESYKKAVELYPTLLDAHKSLLQTYKKMAMKAEAVKEEESIAQIEKSK